MNTMETQLEVSISSVRTGKIIQIKNLLHEVGLLCNDREMDKRTITKIMSILDRHHCELIRSR